MNLDARKNINVNNLIVDFIIIFGESTTFLRVKTYFVITYYSKGKSTVSPWIYKMPTLILSCFTFYQAAWSTTLVMLCVTSTPYTVVLSKIHLPSHFSGFEVSNETLW